MQHSDFVSGWQARTIQIHVERAKALQVISDPAVVPERDRKTHLLWTLLWILSIPGALAVMYFYRWWAGAILLLTVTPALGSSTNKAAKRFIIDRAVADSTFYDYAVESGILHVREKEAKV